MQNNFLFQSLKIPSRLLKWLISTGTRRHTSDISEISHSLPIVTHQLLTELIDPRRPGSRGWRPLFRDWVGFLLLPVSGPSLVRHLWISRPPSLRLSHFFRFLQFGICLQPLHRLLHSGFSSDSPVFWVISLIVHFGRWFTFSFQSTSG